MNRVATQFVQPSANLRMFFSREWAQTEAVRTTRQPKPPAQTRTGELVGLGRQANNGLSRLGPQTKAIHGGEPERHGVNGPVVTEIIRTSTFTLSNTEKMKEWAEGKNKAYIYTRYGNPTLSVAEKKIAALEGAEAAVVAASGMAAVSSSLLAALKAGHELISTAQLCGGTYRLMRDVFPNMGITVHHVLGRCRSNRIPNPDRPKRNHRQRYGSRRWHRHSAWDKERRSIHVGRQIYGDLYSS